MCIRDRLWIAAFFGLTALLGFIAATGLFLIAFYSVKANLDIRQTAAYTMACVALLLVFKVALNLELPEGLISLWFH